MLTSLLAVAVLAGVLLVGPAAHAEEVPADPEPTPPPTTLPSLAPRAAAYLAKLEPLVTEATTRLATATERRDALVAEQAAIVHRLTVADARLAELQALAAAAVARAEETRQRLSVMAAAAYRDAGPTKRAAPDRDIEAWLDDERSAVLSDRIGSALDQLVAQHRREQKAADDARAAVKKEKDYLQRRHRELETAVPAAEAELVAATTFDGRTTRLIEAWRAVQLGPETSIMGPVLLTADELAAWFVGTKRKANITVTIEQLAALYVEEGTAEGVRGDIAWAQSILETGSFGFPDYGQVRGTDNNFAGIGACDSCENGYGFPDARTGVRAQIQHLRNYAQPGVTEAQLANPAVLPKFDQFGLKGRAPTWQGLTGTWASSTTYGPKIFSVYFGILEWVTDTLLLPEVEAARTPR